VVTIDMTLCEITFRDCTKDPATFRTPAEASAVIRLHAAHGPGCLPYLAAHAYKSARLED